MKRPPGSIVGDMLPVGSTKASMMKGLMTRTITGNCRIPITRSAASGARAAFARERKRAPDDQHRQPQEQDQTPQGREHLPRGGVGALIGHAYQKDDVHGEDGPGGDQAD